MKPYEPERMPLRDLDWSELVSYIGMAHAAVARYDGILFSMVNPTLLLSPLTTQEAVLSSRIEGTQATLEDVLQYDASPRNLPEKSGDIREVVNYRTAMQQATARLKKDNLDMEQVCQIHQALLEGVRGHEKARGKIRETQNYIGPHGASIEKAVFVPPSPQDLKPALINLNEFMQGPSKDIVVQCALVHAQFELLHPFYDGNGRVGRILIPLMMYAKGLMNGPTFYISEYFEDNRPAYYDHLAAISSRRDWRGWLIFFLQAVTAQASLNSRRASAILDLYHRMKDEINRLTRSQYTLQTLDALFDLPILTTPEFMRRSHIPRRSAFRILDDLQAAGVLLVREEGSGRRPAKLAFDRLVRITEQKKF